MELLGTLILLAILVFIGWILYRVSLPLFWLGFKLLPTIIGFVIGISVWNAGYDNAGVMIIIGGIIANVIWRKFGRGGGQLR